MRRRLARNWAAVAALAALLAAAACGTRGGALEAGSLPERPNVIIFLVDTLRADAVGFGGYDRDVSPRLDRWAERGVVFDEATTPAGWTKPAVMSLFTGLYPATHAVQDKQHVASDDLLTLAEVFSEAGYETAAFITNFAVSEKFNCVQGFERYRWFDKKVDSPPDVPKQLNYVPAPYVDAEVRAFFEEERERPFLAYVHTTDPHFPYMPPLDYLEFGSDLRDLYDGEVLLTDTVLGGWMDLLEETGLLESSIVVLTSDHGEEFYEHGGHGHGITIFQEIAKVPLVVWAPGLKPGRRDALVSLTDLPPTLVEAAGIDAPDSFAPQGRSLWGLLTGAEAGLDMTWAYIELFFVTKAIAFGFREGPDKLVYIERDIMKREKATGLFDVVADPFEQVNLADERPERTGELAGKMTELRKLHVAAAREVREEALEGEALEKMRALGYVD